MQSLKVLMILRLLVVGLGLIVAGLLLWMFVLTTELGDAVMYGVQVSTWWKVFLVIGAAGLGVGTVLALRSGEVSIRRR